MRTVAREKQKDGRDATTTDGSVDWKIVSKASVRSVVPQEITARSHIAREPRLFYITRYFGDKEHVVVCNFVLDAVVGNGSFTVLIAKERRESMASKQPGNYFCIGWVLYI